MGIEDYLQKRAESVNWNLTVDSTQLLTVQLIEQRNIRWLCHFTPRQNLESIKRIGLRTRDFLDNNAVFTDLFRYDKNSQAICLSISKPNKWMFNKKREQGLDLCLLLIDPSVLYNKHCLFYPHNAATKSYKETDIANFSGEGALERLFDEVITFQKSGQVEQRIFRSWNLALQDCETTSDQAEVQCLDTIEPEYIQYIIEENIPLSYKEISEYVNNQKQDKTGTIESREVKPIAKIIKDDLKSSKPKVEQKELIKDFKESIQEELLDKIEKTEFRGMKPILKIPKDYFASSKPKVEQKEPKKEYEKIDLIYREQNNDLDGKSGNGCCGTILLLAMIIFFLMG